MANGRAMPAVVWAKGFQGSEPFEPAAGASSQDAALIGWFGGVKDRPRLPSAPRPRLLGMHLRALNVYNGPEHSNTLPQSNHRHSKGLG